ncbi:hypothetical protein ACB092_06G188600 [Castanea dentata]
MLGLIIVGLYNAGKSYACDDDDDLIDDEAEDEDEVEDNGDALLYAVKSNRYTFDREDDSADRFGMFRRNYERTLAASVRRAMSKRIECRYVFGFD